MKLSLCMIVRDNEDTIRPCIESIAPWVDEIVVVDTGSEDQTPEILKSYGAKVWHSPWVDDFSASRNESIGHANGEWIFWMDSDDTIPQECGEKLRKLADSSHDPNTMGYVMQVRCPGSGENGLNEFTVVDHVKMFRNRDDLRFEGRIHEQVLMPIRRIGGEVRWTDIHVVHSGSDPSPEAQRRKVERDLRILEKDLAERPDHPFILFNFAMTHAEIGEPEKALHWINRCLAVSSFEESHVPKAFAYQVNSLFLLDQKEEALAASFQARSHFPDDVELLFREAMILNSLGRHQESIERYQRILQLEPSEQFKSTDPGIGGFKCRFNMALAYQDAGMMNESELQLRNILAEVPGYVPAIKALGILLLDLDRLTTAEVEAKKLISDPNTKLEGMLLSAQVFERRGDIKTAARAFEDCKKQYPKNESAIDECSRFFFMNEIWPKAKQYLTLLAKMNPTNAAALHNLGAVSLHTGEFNDAISALKASLELRPDSEATVELLEAAIQNAEPSLHA